MTLRNPNRKPTHPGAILREDVLPALAMTQTEFAQRLAVSRLTVSELLHEKRGLSADLAIRLGKLTGTTPESWLRMQEALALWALSQSEGRRIRPNRGAGSMKARRMKRPAARFFR